MTETKVVEVSVEPPKSITLPDWAERTAEARWEISQAVWKYCDRRFAETQKRDRVGYEKEFEKLYNAGEIEVSAQTREEYATTSRAAIKIWERAWNQGKSLQALAPNYAAKAGKARWRGSLRSL